MRNKKFYWTVYVGEELWDKVDAKRRSQNKKWTQVVEELFQAYLRGALDPIQTHIPLPEMPTGKQTYTGILVDSKQFKTFESKVKQKGWKLVKPKKGEQWEITQDPKRTQGPSKTPKTKRGISGKHKS